MFAVKIIGLLLGILASLIISLVTFNVFRGHFLCPRHQSVARSFLHAVIQHDRPDAEWNQRIGPELQSEGDTLFYLFKVWVVERGISDWDVSIADADLWRSPDSSVDISLHWRQREIPGLSMRVVEGKEGLVMESIVFPLNNCLFNPDKNNDGAIDSVDVRLAAPQSSSRPLPSNL